MATEGMNRAQLLGELGADPELRFTQGGQAVLNIRLATTTSYMDKDRARKERTEWHSVVVFGARAEGLAKHLVKGSRIFVDGEIRTTSYEKDGQKRYKTEIVASNVLFAGGRQPGRETGDGAPDAARAPSQGRSGSGDASQGQGQRNGPRPQHRTERVEAQDEYAGDHGGGGSDDDLPF